MNKSIIYLRVAAVAVSIVWSVSATVAKAEEVTLKFATINADSTRAFKEVQAPLAQAIEKASDGRIKVDLRGAGPNGYGKPAELFGMVEKGDVDIAYTVQGYSPGRFPRTTVAELPLMFRDSQEGTRVLWSLYKGRTARKGI
jgi:TRAP-type C4-dicarboxylate transport system substrate-binding protein